MENGRHMGLNKITKPESLAKKAGKLYPAYLWVLGLLKVFVGSILLLWICEKELVR